MYKQKNLLPRILSRRITRLAIGFLPLALALYLGWGPLHRRYTDWKAEQHRLEARTLAEEGRWQEALELSRMTARRYPEDFENIELLLRAHLETAKPLDTRILMGAYFHPGATIEVRGSLLGIAVAGGDSVTFARLYNALSEKERSHPAIVSQKIRFLAANRQYEEWVQLAREALEKNSGNPATQLGLATALVAGGCRGNPAPCREAQQWIGQLMQNEDATVSLAAFRLLAEIPPEYWEPESLPNLENWLQQYQQAHHEFDPAPVDFLIGFTETLTTLPDSARGDFVDQVVVHYYESDLGLVADWLARVGFLEKALALLNPERGRGSLDLFEKRLRLLFEAKDWEGALDWLEDPHAEADAVRTWLARARIALETKMPSERRSCLEHALFCADILAARNAFFDICDESLRAGEIEMATRAALRGVHHPMAILPASPYFDPILVRLWETNRLEEFRNLLGVLLNHEPRAPHLRNNRAYLNLLESTPGLPAGPVYPEVKPAPKAPDPVVEEMTRLAMELVLSFPDRPEYRAAAGLGLMQLNRLSEAAEVISEISPEGWSSADAADQYIRALILLKTGQPIDPVLLKTLRMNRNDLNQLETAKLADVLFHLASSS